MSGSSNRAEDSSSANATTTSSSSDGGLLMKHLAAKGWDVDGRLYLGFGRQRTSWEADKTD